MLTIYHNPRCSKSRATLELLRAHGIEPRVIEYLQTPPSAHELKHLIELLGLTPRELVRRNEPEYKAARLDEASDTELIRAMVQHPILIERPIVVKGNRAALGRPPENVLKVLKDT